jgi:dihydroxy-acid dehydratase
MPEAGYIPIPKKILAKGVRDMVRISDGRMSGTAFGAVILHVSPEAAVGGPLAVVRDQDRIRLNVDTRSIDLLISEVELERRLSERTNTHLVKPGSQERGYRGLYARSVQQADFGADFDFCRANYQLNASA